MTTDVVPATEQSIDPVQAHLEANRRTVAIRDIRRRRAITEATYKEARGELDTWWAQEQERYDRELAHEEQMLRPLVALLTAGEKRKSISTPAGIAGLRAGRERVVVDDAGACMAWLIEHAPELVRVKPPEPDLRAIGARLAEGERFPGVHVERSDDAFFVDVIQP